MQNISRTEQFGITPQVIDRRLRFFKITDRERQNLQAIKTIAEPKMDWVVDQFYAHLTSFPEVVAIIEKAGSSVESLRKTNPRYFEHMFNGKFDVAYFDHRCLIGEIHARIGLTPEWFIGAFNSYLDSFRKIIFDAHKLRPGYASELYTTMCKVLTLDMMVILECYFEVGYLADVRSALTTLGTTVSTIADSTSQLRDVTSTAQAAGSEVHSASTEVAVASSHQAESATTATNVAGLVNERAAAAQDGTARQAQSLEDVSSAFETVSANIVEIGTQAGRWESIRARIEVMNRLHETVQQTSQSVADMSDRSNEIGRIVGTIDEIASQTNLLALNAAIEAARAGDHGRGFAVVAEEVRKLAENSASAAKEIGNLISSIQEGSQEMTQAMEKTSSEVSEAIEASSEAVSCLEAISVAAREASSEGPKLKSSISLAGDVSATNANLLSEIGTLISELQESIENIGAMTQETAASSEETSASADLLAQQVEDILKRCESIDDSNSELKGIISMLQESMNRGNRSGIARPIRLTEKIDKTEGRAHLRVA
jgi:methyl-accepting chemotaxis protein